MIGIVVSEADTASEHIGECLLSQRSWESHTDTDQPPAAGGGTVYRHGPFELRTFEALHLELTEVGAVFDDPDVIVFASRHSGETGPLLTAHHTGNFGDAEYGGESQSLSVAAPHVTAAVLTALDRNAPDGYDVSLETTHHGPTEVGVPSLFVELGSDTEQWADPAGATAVATAILSLETMALDRDRCVVGIGGGHYAPRFTRIVRDTDWAIGHIAADWGLEALDPSDHSLLHQLFEYSNTTRFVVDGAHPDLTETLTTLGYTQVSETWLRETTGISQELLSRLTAVYSETAAVRFGEPARTASPTAELKVETLPERLVETAANIDRDAVLAACRDHLFAFQIDETTGVPASTVVLSAETPVRGTVPEPFLASLRKVLADRYDTLAVEDTTLVGTRTVFDPELAADRGVPEGPKYGALAAGTPVEIDGETIHPEAVHTTQTQEFSLVSDSQ